MNVLNITFKRNFFKNMETVTPGEIDRLNGRMPGNSRSGHPSKGMAYQAYQVKRRTVVGSPENNELSKYTSPEINRSGNLRGNRSSDNLSQSSGERNGGYSRNDRSRGNDNYSKNPKYQSYSPVVPEVSLPGGTIYQVPEDK